MDSRGSIYPIIAFYGLAIGSCLHSPVIPAAGIWILSMGICCVAPVAGGNQPKGSIYYFGKPVTWCKHIKVRCWGKTTAWIA